MAIRWNTPQDQKDQTRPKASGIDWRAVAPNPIEKPQPQVVEQPKVQPQAKKPGLLSRVVSAAKSTVTKNVGTFASIFTAPKTKSLPTTPRIAIGILEPKTDEPVLRTYFTKYYQSDLGRKPTATELNAAIADVKAGKRPTDVQIERIAASDEAVGFALTPQQRQQTITSLRAARNKLEQLFAKHNVPVTPERIVHYGSLLESETPLTEIERQMQADQHVPRQQQSNTAPTLAQRTVQEVPKAINDVVFGGIGKVVGVVGGIIAAPIAATASRARGKTAIESVLDAFDSFKQSTKFWDEQIKTGVVQGQAEFGMDVARTGSALGQYGLSRVTGQGKEPAGRALYDTAFHKLKAYDGMASAATGRPPATDQELHWMLSSPEGKTSVAAAFALDLYFLGKGATEFKSELVDKQYRLKATERIKPSEEVTLPDGDKTIAPPHAVEGKVGKLAEGEAKYYNIDESLGETGAKRPTNLLRVTPAEDGTYQLDYFRYERPINPMRGPYQTEPIREAMGITEAKPVDPKLTEAVRAADTSEAPTEVMNPKTGQVTLERPANAPELTKTISVAELTKPAEQRPDLTLYTGDKTAAEPVREVQKSYQRVLSVTNDQHDVIRQLAEGGDKQAQAIRENFSYQAADEHIRQVYQGRYDAIEFKNEHIPQRGIEYLDLTDRTSYAVNRETARAYAMQNRSAKYQEPRKIVDVGDSTRPPREEVRRQAETKLATSVDERIKELETICT